MSVVLDASAALAFLKSEPGSEVVHEYLQRACISTVNLLEVLEKCLRLEDGIEKTLRLLRGWQVEFVPFEEVHFLAATITRQQFCQGDVSLADRICLSLATVRNLPVVTADRLWLTLPLDLKVILIRGESH